jgi:hypothetical protein
LPALVERYLSERGCNEPNWDMNVTVPFGYARKVLPRIQEFIVCDPLSSSAWRNAVRTQLWAGDPEAALQTARRGSEQAPGEWLSMQLIATLVALGKFEQAENEVAERLRVDTDILQGRLMIAASQGNRISVSGLLEQYLQHPRAEDYTRTLLYAWSGERDQANMTAARIDGHAFGSPTLTVVLIWCFCGAPWDLSATPNFAAVLEKSGLPWPPESPIDFPLKNW